MIVDLTYYTDYRKTPVVSSADFDYYSKQAERELTRQTFGQLATATVTEDIQDCICDIAEYLYQCDKAYSPAHGGNLTSYSNDGDSGSIDKSMFAEDVRPKKIRAIVKKYLSGTTLLQGGVDISC
jgi:hypothetical protein